MAIYPQGTFEYTGGISLDNSSILGGWSVTLTHGLTPSVFTVRVPMVDGATPPQKNGDVVLRYGESKITLKSCTIDFIEQDVSGELIWVVTILDRRYLWRFGQVTGAYNMRWHNGTDVREETKKKPSELAKICLEKMWRNSAGDVEQNYDVDALKDFDETDWPEINWDVANPAESLQALCERYGCRAVYDWKQDRVHVVKIGEGQELDLEGSIVQFSGAFDPPEKPGKIILLCAPSSVQYDFPLETVMLDADGEIKYPNEVSYVPKQPDLPAGAPVPDLTSGTYADTHWAEWANASANLLANVSIPYLRQLAERSLLRWYRIVPPANMKGLDKIAGDAFNSLKLGDFGSIAEDKDRSWLSQIVLQSDQNDRESTLADPQATEFDEYNKQVSSRPLPAWVYGNYQLPDEGSWNSLGNNGVADLEKLNPAKVYSPAQQNASTLPNKDEPDKVQDGAEGTGFYAGGFSIDAERGLVIFSQMVKQSLRPTDAGLIFKLADGTPPDSTLSSTSFPATLWLRARFYVADKDTRGLVRYQRTRVLDENSETVRYVVRNDLTFKLTYRFDGAPDVTSYPPSFEPTDTDHNGFEIDDACDTYLDQIEREYETRQPQTVVYPGFLPMTLDGAIRQITWTVDGEGRAFTRVSRDKEELHLVRDYRDRRMAERLKAMADKAAVDPPRISGTFTGRVHVRHNSFWHD